MPKSVPTARTRAGSRRLSGNQCLAPLAGTINEAAWTAPASPPSPPASPNHVVSRFDRSEYRHRRRAHQGSGTRGQPDGSDQVVHTADGKDYRVLEANVVGLRVVRGCHPNPHGTANLTTGTGTSLIDQPLNQRNGEWQPPARPTRQSSPRSRSSSNEQTAGQTSPTRGLVEPGHALRGGPRRAYGGDWLWYRRADRGLEQWELAHGKLIGKRLVAAVHR